jgi:AraC-like DNA-binding protein
MDEITVPAKKFLRLFDYLERIGIDAQAIAAEVDILPARIAELAPEHRLPALHYARLYKSAAAAMQQFGQPVPWAAGLGSEVFEVMCHCMIGGRTLRDALRLAERFDRLMFPLNKYRIALLEEPDSRMAKLSYTIDISEASDAFIPQGWDRQKTGLASARASGLVVWHALCGWLTGHSLRSAELRIDSPAVGQDYQDSLSRTISGAVFFGAGENTCSFDRRHLDRRVVHSPDSLNDFLSNSVYQLIALDSASASTSAAIKSLINIDLPNGIPSFSHVASMLYMSESSLRRRLKGEDTNYQALKDEVRCERAIDQLLNDDTRMGDIAELLGFTEPSSFVRSFKNWTGDTPKQYKEKILALGGH